METYTSKYETTLEQAELKLTKYGVCVIPNILSKDECKSCVSDIWAHLEHSSSEWETPMKRTDKSTWSMKNFNPQHSMLVQHYAIGHCQAAWNIRQNPKVVEAFSHLFDTKQRDMLTSFDGISVCFPPEVVKHGWSGARSSWPHCDTSYTKTIDYSNIVYQGWVTPVDVGNGDATLACLVKSHKYHKDIANKFELKNKANWHKLSDKEEKAYVDKGCIWNRIKCPAGSLVLWDCRLIHYGQQPMKGRPEENTRFCIYVCMVPRERATPANLRKKIKAFEELRLTSHEPATVKLFPANPSTRYGPLTTEKIAKVKDPELTRLGKRLAGY